MSGPQFDRWYSSLEVKDHEQDSPEVKRSAKKELPVLRLHLMLSKQAWQASAR